MGQSYKDKQVKIWSNISTSPWVNMNLVYAFLNNNFSKIESNKKDFSYASMPDYYKKTFDYNMQHFDGGHMICQEEEAKTGLFTNYITTESLMNTVEYKFIHKLLEDKWARYKIEFFLYHAFIRLIFVCIAVKIHNLKNVVHIEADNIIYMDARDRFNAVYGPGEFGYGLVSALDASPGVIFLKDADAADRFLEQIRKLLQRGESEIIKATGIPFSYITDMNFLYLMFLYNKHYKMLPCLPTGECSQNFDKFKILFDPAGYGQFLGGTNNGNSAGYINPRQFVGNFMQQKLVGVQYRGKKPYVSFNELEIPLYNLHMHNKKAIESFI